MYTGYVICVLINIDVINKVEIVNQKKTYRVRNRIHVNNEIGNVNIEKIHRVLN